MEMTYRVGDLRKLVTESSEFKAVLGAGVESDNKKNNDKAYSDAKKRAKDYDGGLKDETKFAKGEAKYEKTDGNGTLLDYKPQNKVTDAQKKRIKGNVEGYDNGKDNGIEKVGDFSGNKDFYDAVSKCGKEMHKNQEDDKAAGLKSHNLPKETFKQEELYESKDGVDMRNFINLFNSTSRIQAPAIQENVDTVYFKKMSFLNEEHMFSRIPDEYKVEGCQFKMKDKTENEYLLEWKNNNGRILAHTNKGGMNESLDRMKYLSGYKSSDSKTTKSYRANEGESSFVDTLSKARQMNK